MLETAFGCQKAGAIYTERTGAYGVGFFTEGNIPLAMTHLYHDDTGYFLLGGEIENNESRAQCIVRETTEAAGLAVTPKALVCKGDDYHSIDRRHTYFHGSYFYYMELCSVVAARAEPGRLLVWLSRWNSGEPVLAPSNLDG